MANFVFIKRLVIASKDITEQDFKEAMASNFFLFQEIPEEIEEVLHHHHDVSEGDRARAKEELNRRVKAKNLCKWVDLPVEEMKNLKPGEVFKGITRDSFMITCEVVGKDKDGNPLYFPIDDGNPTEIGILQRYNYDTKQFEELLAVPLDEMEEITHEVINDGDFFKVTNLENEIIDIFDEDDDDDGGKLYYCFHDESDDTYEFKSVNEILQFARFFNSFQDHFKEMINGSKEAKQLAEEDQGD